MNSVVPVCLKSLFIVFIWLLTNFKTLVRVLNQHIFSFLQIKIKVYSSDFTKNVIILYQDREKKYLYFKNGLFIIDSNHEQYKIFAVFPR